MGPIELADQVGLDICLQSPRCCARNSPIFPGPPPWLKDKVAKGELGSKTGKGLYDWKDGKAEGGECSRNAEPTPEMTDRLILPMSNVCVACLREGVADDADLIDGAMIFATGSRRSVAVPCTMRGAAGPKTWLPACGRWRRNLAAVSRLMPVGKASNDICRYRTKGAPNMTDTPAVDAPPNSEIEPCGDLSIRTLATAIPATDRRRVPVRPCRTCLVASQIVVLLALGR